jgi:hypothetical protein
MSKMDSKRKRRREIYKDLAKWLSSCKEDGLFPSERQYQISGKANTAYMLIVCRRPNVEPREIVLVEQYKNINEMIKRKK